MDRVTPGQLPSSPFELLQPRLNVERIDWHTLAGQKFFIVRGLTWFQSRIPDLSHALIAENSKLSDELQQLSEWRGALGNIQKPRVSRRQLESISHFRPLKFEKAALSILLLELAVRRKEGDYFEGLSNVRIEPVVFSIKGFDR